MFRYSFLLLFISATLLYAYYAREKVVVENSKYSTLGTFVEKYPEKTRFVSWLDNQPTQVNFNSSKIILVHFWATWCAPCAEEYGAIVRLQERFKDKIDVYTVAINDDAMSVKKFFKRFENRLDSKFFLADNNEEYRSLFGVTKIPETFVFGPNQKTIRRFVGPQKWDEEFFDEYFSVLIKN